MTDTILSGIKDFASSINDYISAGIIILSAILLNFLAPDVPMKLTRKLLWLSVVIALWVTFVQPYQADLERLIIVFFTIFLYKILTEQAAIFISQAFLFLVTFKIFVWFFDIGHPNETQSLPHAEGFSSRRV